MYKQGMALASNARKRCSLFLWKMAGFLIPFRIGPYLCIKKTMLNL